MSSERDLKHAAARDGGSKQDCNDIDHGLGDPAEDEAVHEQPQVDGLESAQKCRGFAAVANLNKLHIGQNFGAPPITGEKEYRQHAAHTQSPPYPVPGDALSRYQAADQQRGIRGERSRNHRGSGQPPGNVPPGNEEFFGIAAGATPVVDADQQIDQQVTRNHHPVNRGKRHESSAQA
jgi:hypothetical protein